MAYYIVTVQDEQGKRTRIQFGCDAPARQTLRLIYKLSLETGQFTGGSMEFSDTPISRSVDESKRAEAILTLLYQAPEGEA